MGRGSGYCDSNHQSAGAPALEVLQHGSDPALAKLAVEVVQTGLLCHSVSKEGTDGRACGCDRGVVVPRLPLPRRKYGGENVGTAKAWHWGAVDDGEKE